MYELSNEPLIRPNSTRINTGVHLRIKFRITPQLIVVKRKIIGNDNRINVQTHNRKCTEIITLSFLAE